MEFDLIYRHFAALGAARADTLLGVGDDAALIQAPSDHALHLSHAVVEVNPQSFHAQTAVHALLHECTSQLPEGATIQWALLALTATRTSDTWLTDLAAELDRACQARTIQVVGGDTTSGSPAIELFCLAAQRA